MTAHARYRSTDLAPGVGWRRVECVETGESVDVRSPRPGHVLRALALLSAECSCGGGWHFEVSGDREVSDFKPKPAEG